jgi:hypothetical protein
MERRHQSGFRQLAVCIAVAVIDQDVRTREAVAQQSQSGFR